MFNKFAATALSMMLVTAWAHAEPNPSRTGLGQDTPMEPPMIRNLKLSDPLVQQKYLNEPDMLRFLRATYSEGCVRGMLAGAAKQIRIDATRNTPKEREVAGRLLDSNRIWKMSSYEMEVFMGKTYLHSANYCDCLMKEISNVDLVNPKKGLEVIGALPKSTLKTCERIATDKTEQQLADKNKKE